MYRLNYELWQEIIEEAASEYAPLFSLMHEMAKELPLSRDLVDDLKCRSDQQGSCDQRQIWLHVDSIDDNIQGFRVYLVASEDLNALKEMIFDTAICFGISPEEIDAFEVEGGLDMLGEVLEKFKDVYEIQPQIYGDCVLFMLIVFDSQDIDDSMSNNVFWEEYGYTN